MAAAKLQGLGNRMMAGAEHIANEAGQKMRYATGNLNAVDMLMNQHREAESLFEKIAAAKQDPKSQQRLLEQLCDSLLLHMRIEEEIFYPTAREHAKGEASFLNHSEEEHHEAKKIIAEILRQAPGSASDADFQARIHSLCESIKKHVDEEEKELFPSVRKVMDEKSLKQLGEQMHTRFGELKGQGKPREMAFKDTSSAQAVPVKG